MNAVELIEEVVDIIDSPDSFSTTKLLSFLNRGQRAIAGRLLLPALADGYDTVTTATDGFTVALPSTFHRELFRAQVDGYTVKIYPNIEAIADDVGKIGTTSGKVTGVCLHGGSLAYQRVPASATGIELFYYRKPVDMTESTASYPDGLQGNVQGASNDQHDWALIHYASAECNRRIEQGVEGQKVDTRHYYGLYKDNIAEMRSFFPEGRAHKPAPIVQVNW